MWIRTQIAKRYSILNSAHIVDIWCDTTKVYDKGYRIYATLDNGEDVELGKYQGFQLDSVIHKLMVSFYNDEHTFIMPYAVDVPTPTVEELESRQAE